MGYPQNFKPDEKSINFLQKKFRGGQKTLDLLKIIAHVAAINQRVMGLDGEGQPDFFSFRVEFPPRDTGYGIDGVVMHGVLQAGETNPGYSRKVEVVISSGFVLHGRVCLQGFHFFLRMLHKAGIFRLIVYGTKAEYFRYFRKQGKRGVHRFMFHYFFATDALAKGRYLVGGAGNIVYYGRRKRLPGLFQCAQQMPNFNSGADIEMGLIHFTEKIKVFAPVLISKVNGFHDS